MRVLMAGRDGRVGSELVRQLDPAAEVFAPSRGDVDLRDADAIVAAVRTYVPDLIINTAACGATSATDPDTALSIYAHAPRVFAEEAERLGVPLLHYSTDQLFDGTSEAAYAEEDDPSPNDVIGRAQLLGERAVLALGGPALLIRVAWVYRIRDLVAATAFDAVSPTSSPQIGSPTWGRDIAGATLQALDALVGKRGLGRDRLASVLRERGGVFHMAAGGQTDDLGFVAALEQAAVDEGAIDRPEDGFDRSVAEPAEDSPSRRNRQLDTRKLSSELGVELPTWEAGLLEACAELTGQRTTLTL